MFSLFMAVGVAMMGASDAAAWNAGVAAMDVTPQEPMWLAGYASRDHASEGQLHPIWVKALAIEDAEGARAVLVTADNLGFPKGMSDRIRDRINEKYKLSRAQILLNGSHTHSGPVLRDSLYSIYPLTPEETGKIERYSDDLENKVVDLIGKALANLAPARISAGNSVTRFAVNRRNNKEAEILRTYDLNGPVDHAVPVLKVEREDGALLAIAFGYACHGTTLDICRWSGDYPGFAQIELEKAHPGATALFFAGCGADQNPLPRRTVELARQYGRELSAAVERVMAEPMRPLAPKLATEYVELDLGLMPAPSLDEFKTMAAQSTGWQQRAAQIFVAKLEAGQTPPATRSFPAQLWRIGDQTLVSLGGEVVVDYALSIKQMLGPDIFVLGYSNDLLGYIPSLRVLREGGYEGAASQLEYELPSKWQEDIESKILSAVEDMADKAGLARKSTGAIASGWQEKILTKIDQSYAGWDVEIGDADNDGKNDILVTGCPNSQLHMLKQAGAEWTTVRLADNLAETTPGMGLSVNVLDLNRDGKNEIIHGTGQEGPGTAFFYVMQTDGSTLTSKVACRPEDCNKSGFTHSFAPYDLDGDGILEVISAYCGGGEIIRYDIGGDLKTIEARKIYNLTGSGEESQIADVDNDGKPEYLTCNGFRDGRGQVEIFEFDAAGELVLPPRVTIPGYDGNKCFYCSLIVGDVNNDGINELVVGWKRDQKVNISTLLAYKVGDTAEVVHKLDCETPDLDMGYFEKMMAIADADNDGKKELVVSTRGDNMSEFIASDHLGHIFVYRVDGEKVSRELLMNFDASCAESSWIAVGDADNDGKNEIVAATGKGNRMKPGKSYVVMLKKN